MAAFLCLVGVFLSGSLVPVHAAGSADAPGVEQVAGPSGDGFEHDHRLCLLYWGSFHDGSVPSAEVRIAPPADGPFVDPSPADPTSPLRDTCVRPRAPPAHLLTSH